MANTDVHISAPGYLIRESDFSHTRITGFAIDFVSRNPGFFKTAFAERHGLKNIRLLVLTSLERGNTLVYDSHIQPKPVSALEFARSAGAIDWASPTYGG